jgi:hypothetical protein
VLVAGSIFSKAVTDEQAEEAALRAQREALERDLFQAQQRASDAKRKLESARKAADASRRSQYDDRTREQSMEARTLQGGDLFGLGPLTVPSQSGTPADEDLPPPTPEATAEVRRAEDASAAANAAVADIEKKIADLPTYEDILGDMGPEADSAAANAILGRGATPADEEAEAVRSKRRALVALALAGSLVAAALLYWLWSQGQGGRRPSATAVLPTAALPTGVTTGAPSAPASVAATPTRVATPRPATQPPPTPVPLSERPAVGDSSAIFAFVRDSGECPFADEFNAAFHLLAEDGVATLTQFPGEHVTSGTLMRTSPAGGLLVTEAPGQTYNLTVSGNRATGTYLDRTPGCNDLYNVEGFFDRPLLAPPPFNNAPLFFAFATPEGPVLLPPAGTQIFVSVESYGDPVVVDFQPIRVELHVGDETPWNFTIDGGSGDDEICPTSSRCGLHAPSPLDAAWLAPDAHPILVAYDGGDDLIAVWAPNDMDAFDDWLLDQLARQ